tara:strand:+ start:488 stop:685 length:198 start_codon:yes stop_codon:yes gene_type:complete
MAKGKKQIVYMIPEGESRDSHTYHYTTHKTASMLSDGKKLRLRKFNPVKNKHEMFVEAKLPRHTK